MEKQCDIEQNLGVWNSLFEKKPFAVLAGAPLSVFKNKPTSIDCSHINTRIIEVREFRNRINHNEPVCFVNGKKDFSYALDMHRKIMELLEWIDDDIPKSLVAVDKVMIVIDKHT